MGYKFENLTILIYFGIIFSLSKSNFCFRLVLFSTKMSLVIFLLIDCLNLWRHSYFTAILLRGDVHAQLVMQKVKMRFSIQPTHPPLKTLGVTIFFFFFLSTILHRYHWRQSNRKKPTIITWFDQNGKYYNQNKKILHLRFTHDTPSCSIDRYDKAMTKF